MTSEIYGDNPFTDRLRLANECLPYFQPFMDNNGSLFGMEILARWEMPDKSILYPDQFIPQVNKAGLSGLMTSILLEKTAEILFPLKENFPEGSLVSFNLDMVDSYSDTIIDACHSFRRSLGADSPVLICELTERRKWGQSPEDHTFLKKLEARHIPVALDDFGTELCNLDMQCSVRAGYLKIDRSFISRLNEDPASWRAAECAIFTARKYSQRIIAEGVETRWQYDWLKQQGVDLYQGYYFSPPLSAEQLSEFIRQRGSKPEGKVYKHKDYHRC